MSESTLRPFPRERLSGHPTEVAPLVLNAVLVVGERAGRIVEVEAYAGTEDPASHAYRGKTDRTAAMFGRAGTLYTYLSYGIHTCANITTGTLGVGQAVLLRAIQPLWGIEAMRADRPAARSDVELGNGPGKLCAALGITLADYGADVCERGEPDMAGVGGIHTRTVRLFSDGQPPPDDPVVTARVGISRAEDRPWRFVVGDSPYVSRGPRSKAGAG